MPSWFWNTACFGLACTAFSIAATASGSLPAWRYSRPRLACTPPSSGFDAASAFNWRSASSWRPARSARLAVSNAACARASTGTSGSACTTGAALAGAAGAALAPALSAAAARSAGVGSAGFAASTDLVSSLGVIACLTRATGSGSDAHADNAAASATATPRASRGWALSTNRIDHAFTAFQFAVAHRPQRGQRLEAFLHPLVVEARGRALGVDLVQLHRLFFERERLLLEHHVVLFELGLRQLLRALRSEHSFAEVLIQRGSVISRCGRDVGHAVIRGCRIG